MILECMRYLQKIAAEGPVKWDVDKHIPILTHVPSSTEKAKQVIERHIEKADPGSWSHAQIAVPAKRLNLEEMGFTPNRVAIP